MAVDGDSPVPEECEYGPGIGTRDSGKVHKVWKILVAPVSNELVDEMGHQNNLGTPEVVASP